MSFAARKMLAEWPDVRMREWDWRRDLRVEMELGRKRLWIGWMEPLDGGD